MLLFLKSFIVGIGKIIPGVSGAMLAINFGIYEKLLDSLTNFINNWKDNLRFIIIFCMGLFLAIILCSGVILYLLNNYKFITMMFFLGLIIGGTYNFSKNIRYSIKNIFLIIFVIISFLVLSFSDYIFYNSFKDNMIFFLGGFIEIFASIVPGISGTSLLMMVGIYDEVLNMLSSIFDYGYVVNNIDIYISYGFGMFISFIINIYLIKYLINRYKNSSYSVILGLSISSIIYLINNTLNTNMNIIEIIIGIMFLIVGLLISSILDK